MDYQQRNYETNNLYKSRYNDVLRIKRRLYYRQGAQWRDFRTKVNPAMLKIKLVRVYTPLLEEIADDFVERYYRYILILLKYERISKFIQI